MGGYKKPKARIHREFLYLNDSTVVNALSAIEAGKVDEIIEQAKTTTGSGVEAGLGYGPAKIAARRDGTRTSRRTSFEHAQRSPHSMHGIDIFVIRRLSAN